MKRAALLALVLLVACAEWEELIGSEPSCVRPGHQAPRVELVSNRGVHVHVPQWVPQSWHADLLQEVDDTKAMNGTKPLPSNWSVWIGSPGKLENPDSPTGLAAGNVCAKHKQIVAAWKFAKGQGVRPYLPSLSHEVRHVVDPKWSHGTCPGCMGESP